MIPRLVTENSRAINDALYDVCVIVALAAMVGLLGIIASEIMWANNWRAETMRETKPEPADVVDSQ